MVRIVAILGSLISVVALACHGCHPSEPPAGPAAVPSAAPSSSAAGTTDAAATETLVHVEDNGKTFDLPRGASLVFRLVTHGGTGFVWMPVPADGGVLVQHGDRTTELPSNIAGAPRTDVYYFVAETPGTTTIEMALRRPWGDAPPAKTLRVTVNVR